MSIHAQARKRLVYRSQDPYRPIAVANPPEELPLAGRPPLRDYKLPVLVLRHRQTWYVPVADLVFPPTNLGRLSTSEAMEFLWRRLGHRLASNTAGTIPFKIADRPKILDALSSAHAWHVIYSQREVVADGSTRKQYYAATVTETSAETTPWPTAAAARRAFHRRRRG